MEAVSCSESAPRGESTRRQRYRLVLTPFYGYPETDCNILDPIVEVRPDDHRHPQARQRQPAGDLSGTTESGSLRARFIMVRRPRGQDAECVRLIRRMSVEVERSSWA